MWRRKKNKIKIRDHRNAGHEPEFIFVRILCECASGLSVLEFGVNIFPIIFFFCD